MQIIKITNPANPVRVGGYDTSGEARGVQVVSNRVDVADSNWGLLILEEVGISPEPLRLEITRGTNGMVLSWPAVAGALLETTTALTSPTWQTVSNTPALSGDRYVLTNSWSDPQRFFRLKP